MAWLRALGPGVLFAAAAVGVSHLVQSTRAGAQYGLGLIGVVLLANLLKYPGFRFGPEYAAATGTSLLEGYRRRGVAALYMYGALTLGTMFTVQAGVTVVTAGLAMAVFGLSGSTAAVSGAVLLLCGAVLAVGRFRGLDRIVKLLVAALTISTVAATALAAPAAFATNVVNAPSASVPSGPMGGWSSRDVFFCAALFGWMPSAIDISVWQSLWTLERSRDVRRRISASEVRLDFHLGYLGTAALAICFLIMGAGVMHGRGLEFADGAAGFAAQLIDLYAATLGDWTRPLVGVAALAVMFSTTLTVLDGFPRALETLAARLRGPEAAIDPDAPEARAPTYWAAMVLLASGAIAVIAWRPGSLKGLVDIATTLSFLTAPAIAFLNHLAITGPEVPRAQRPRPRMLAMSWTSIVLQGLFALGYLIVRYGGVLDGA